MSEVHANAHRSDAVGPAAAPVRQIVAVYDNNDCAHVARDGLLAAGIPRAALHLIERADPAHLRITREARRQAFWAIVGSLFKPAEDPSVYHLAADPNHALLILQPDAHTDVRRAAQVLRASRPFYVFPALDAEGHLFNTR